MDVSSVVGLTSALSQTQVRDEVEALVLRKVLDSQAQSVLTLLQAVPQTASNPPNLGNNIDVRV